jgi:cell division septum initiation protein DivIVA
MESSGLLNPARLTVETLDNRSFTRTRWGASGLDPDEVRIFIEQVKAELVLRDEEHSALAAELARCQQGDSAPAHGFSPPSAELHAVHILQRAQANAENLVTDAQQRARELAEDAHRRRDSILADAKSKADALLRTAMEDASREAAAVIAKAPIEAQTRLAMYQTLGNGLRGQLKANLDGLLAMLDQWERQAANLSAQTSSLMGVTDRQQGL